MRREFVRFSQREASMCQSSVENWIMMMPKGLMLVWLSKIQLCFNGLIIRNNPNEQVCKKKLVLCKPDLQILSYTLCAADEEELSQLLNVRANFKTIDRF